MKITFWGTRGSVPTPGRYTYRYGGNTPCIELRLDNNKLIILDAGTGIRNLGDALTERGEQVDTHILISHPHWDHIQGFPFFRPIYQSGNSITIVGGESGRVSLHKMIADQMNRVYFPIHWEELKAKLHFRKVMQEEFSAFDATVKTLYVNHPTFAVGYRITHKGKTLVYISDNEPFDPSNEQMKKGIEPWIAEEYMRSDGDPNQRVYDFASGADVLIHDATYTPDEYKTHVAWGHSHYLYTIRVAMEARVKKLILFHHDPSHTDEMVDEIVRKAREEIRNKNLLMECDGAQEGMQFEIC
jgi:phosphoribosyl 1,2-cyclic phosphodiesterase